MSKPTRSNRPARVTWRILVAGAGLALGGTGAYGQPSHMESAITPAQPAAATHAPTSEQARGPATRVVSQLHAGLQQLGGDSIASRTLGKALSSLLDTTHDMPYITRLVLGSGGRKITEAQRLEFQQAFRALSVANYASRMSQLTQQKLRIQGEREANFSQRQVDTLLQSSDGKEIQLTYLLRQHEGGWRIINILADGVSDLALRRAEYARLMERSGFDGLLLEIQAQTKSLLAQVQHSQYE